MQIGVSSKKNRKFDPGSDDPPVLVECKSHTWTRGGNVPSAKMTVWNEAMYLFLLAPMRFRKVLFVLRDFNEGRSESLVPFPLEYALYRIFVSPVSHSRASRNPELEAAFQYQLI